MHALRVAPVLDPGAPQVLELEGGFEWRVLALAKASRPDEVAQVVVTVWDTDARPGPQPISQARWLEGLPAPLAAGQAWVPRLTGWQRSYSPRLGRELVWGCTPAVAGLSPEGWEKASGTASAAAFEAQRPAEGSTIAAAADSGVVRVAWMGDVMLADGPGRLIARGRDPFEHVAGLLRGADLRIANLECVIATGGRAVVKPWVFRAHPRSLPVLQRHVDAVSLANNHSGDYGPAAFAQMLGRLDRAGLPHFGGGRNLREAHAPRILERRGVRIALLGFNEMFPRLFEAGDRRPGIAWLDEERVVAAIAQARQQADVVIPYLHWGQEGETVAHERQRALARRMIEAGAAAVVGTHPHVRQDTEVIDGRPVIYSLGNFVFDGFEDEDSVTGSILWMEVDRQGVRDWRLQAVRLDAQGRPRPLR